MNRRSFIKNIAIFSGVTFFVANKFLTIKNKPKPKQEHLFGGLPYLYHFEVHLVEHCNLNCKYCSHFASIAEKKFYNVKDYKRDLARLAYLTGGRIKSIQLLGGEPLLHPDLIKLIRITRFYFPSSDIDIITNCTLLNTMRNSFWKACNENNINIIPSVYPIKIDWNPIFTKADKYGVKFITDATRETLNINNIQNQTVTCFYKLKIDRKGKQDYVKRFKECNYRCNNFIDGKLYPCFVASNIKHFNKRFKQHIPITDKDYIDVYKAENINQLLDLLYNPVPFCKYCAAFEFNKPWGYGNQDISEWT